MHIYLTKDIKPLIKLSINTTKPTRSLDAFSPGHLVPLGTQENGAVTDERGEQRGGIVP
jgi:hypothetical protein